MLCRGLAMIVVGGGARTTRTRPPRVAAYLLAALLCGIGPRRARAVDEYEFHHENVIGTSLELRVRAEDERAARGAEGRVLGAIDRLSAIFSGFDPASELSRWQAAAKVPMRVSAELFEVLRASERWVARGGGAFDPRVEALTRLWSSSARRDRLPTAEEWASARALMDRPAWRLDPGAGTVERLSDCPLSLNGIAKGYIVERACDAALEPGRGVFGILLNVGGDLRVGGEIEGTIGIAAPWADSESSEPLTLVAVKDRSVATSGSSQRGFRIGGRWYSHIFDPRSGRPVDRVVAATVIAERAADADAFAKVCNVLDPEESVRMARGLAGVECLIITRDGRTVRSDGWHRYERPWPPLPALAARTEGARGEAPQAGAGAAAAAPWNPEFELVVNFEINRPQAESGRYRRPYVSVWVEDQDGNSVRTLALWVSMGGAGPFQWMPDLKRWYTKDLERKRRDKKDLFFTIARPTRPPGKYRVVWDGKDDQGRLLPAGAYTVSIEAAREHGTYQSIRKPVTLSDRPFTEELQGNVEIRSASIEYRRKGAPR
jgi:thiamine biosynthesis lipoprotein ApbE